MRLKTFSVLLLAALWGVGSWWWYTCKIKSYCAESSALSALIGTGVSTLSAKLNGQSISDNKTQNTATDQANSDNEANSGSEPAKPDAIEKATDTGTATNSGTTQTNTAQEVPTTDAGTDTQIESGAANLNETENNAPSQDTEGKSDSENTVKEAENNAIETDGSTSENVEQSVDETQAQTNIVETVEPDDASPEKLPTIPEDKTDSDNDGITDIMEEKLTTDPRNPDSDGDGLLDLVELGGNLAQPLDSDNDGAIDAQDEDDDNDGDLTIDEAADPDKNGLPDDARDYDQDGTPDYLDPDTNYASRDDDGDGLLNGEEKRLGTNPTLTDSDGDGLSDKFEAVDAKDSDNDGTIDALDPDDDDDGVMTVMENADPDGDGDPSDAVDSNDNNKPDYLDTDNTPTELPKDPPEETQEKALEEETKAGSQNTDDNPAESKAKDTEEAAAEDKSEASDSDSTTNDDQEVEQKTDTQEAEDNSDKVTVDTSDAEQGDGNEIRTAKLSFPFRSAEPELSESAANYFDLVIKQLKDNPDVKIKLTGHTDSVGRGAANRKLGLKRAEQVRDMLTKRGAPKKQIKVESAGESEPIADNKLETGRKKNRRVELEQIK